MTGRRLIEETFPLKKASADSRHEKNVRHGHISVYCPRTSCTLEALSELVRREAGEFSALARAVVVTGDEPGENGDKFVGRR